MIQRNEGTVDIVKIQFRMRPGVNGAPTINTLTKLLRSNDKVEVESVEAKLITDVRRVP